MKKIKSPIVVLNFLLIFIIAFILVIGTSKNNLLITAENPTKEVVKKNAIETSEKYYTFGNTGLVYAGDGGRRYLIMGGIFYFDYLKLEKIELTTILSEEILQEPTIYQDILTIDLTNENIYAIGINTITIVCMLNNYQATNFYTIDIEITINDFDNNVLYQDLLNSSLIEFPQSSALIVAPLVTQLDFNYYFLDNLLNADYELGYESGYNDGLSDCENSPTCPPNEFSLNWLIEVFRVVERFLDIELLPGFSIKLMVIIPLALSLLYALLKLLR